MPPSSKSSSRWPAAIHAPVDDTPALPQERVRELLHEIVCETDRIDLRRYETESRTTLATELVPLVCDALDRTIGFAQQLETLGDAAPQEVSDCAFMVRMELTQRKNRLESLVQAGDAAEVLIGCDSALRNCVKCMRALGQATGERASVLPGYDSDLSSALRVRHAYARFRRRVSALADPEASEAGVRVRLLQLRTIIAAFLCTEAYSVMRVADRHAIRAFRTRMADWLKQKAPRPLEGLSIWKDFRSYADLLGQVNRREVLVEHDQRRLRELLKKRGAVLTTDFLVKLASLAGLDPRLDALLERPHPPRSEELWPLLDRLAAEHGVTRSDVG